MIDFKPSLTLLLILASSTSAFAAASSDYHPFVSPLSSESDSVRNEAIGHLKEIPTSDLDAQLNADLKSSKPASALKVIRALKETSTLESVLQLARTKPTTEVYQTLHSLLSSTTQDSISALVSRQVSSSDTHLSSGAVIIGLEILSASSIALPIPIATRLLNGKSYEVRIALLGYIGSLLKQGKAEPYLPLISDALVSNPYQLRLQAAEVAEQLSKNQRTAISDAIHKCSSDRNTEVQKKCKELATARGGA